MENSRDYELTHSTNWDKLLDFIGVSQELRNRLDDDKPPTIAITQSEIDWTIQCRVYCKLQNTQQGAVFRVRTTYKFIDILFKVGQEFTEEIGDGKQCKTIIQVDVDGNLMQIQRYDGQARRICYFFEGDLLKMTIERSGGEEEPTLHVWKKEAA